MWVKISITWSNFSDVNVSVRILLMLLLQALRLNGWLGVVSAIIKKRSRIQFLGMPAEGRVKARLVEGARFAPCSWKSSLRRGGSPHTGYTAAQVLVESANKYMYAFSFIFHQIPLSSGLLRNQLLQSMFTTT